MVRTTALLLGLIAAAAGEYRGARLLALLERNGLTVKDGSRIVFLVKGGAPRTLSGSALRGRQAILADSVDDAPLPLAPGLSGVIGEQDELRELLGNVEAIRVEEGP